MSREYSLDELMVVEASRYIDDGDVVMVGTGMPMVASLFAQKNHAPRMCYIVETGPVAPQVIPTPISVSDPRVMYRAVRLGSLLDALGGVLQRGLADVAFLGGAPDRRVRQCQLDSYRRLRQPQGALPGQRRRQRPRVARLPHTHNHPPREAPLPAAV